MEYRDERRAPSQAPANLDVMNFLNEIAERHPAAISFASGRPAEAFFDVEDWLSQVPAFTAWFAQRLGLPPDAGLKRLAQYGRTDGIINALLARQLAADEGIQCDESQIVVTGGCQEALDLSVSVLCREPGDVVLAHDPTYIGITGAAARLGVGVVPFSAARHDGLLPTLQQAVQASRTRGENPRVLYLIPNFSNPTGEDLPLAVRDQLVAYCSQQRIAVLEDNPYGMFRFEGEPIPAMFSRPGADCVLYCGTFSKTLCPALRVGFVVLPERLFGSHGERDALRRALSQAKSYVSVNTGQIAQAVVGGVLLAQEGSLARLVRPAVALYRRHRDLMCERLQAELGDLQPEVRWNRPQGGFFLTVSLPFAFGDAEVAACAEQHGVLVMPMAYFALGRDHDHQVRLAFSYADESRIREGVARFAGFVRQRLGVARREPAAAA